MKITRLLLLVFSLLTITLGLSQDEIQTVEKDSIVESSWIFGVGFNVVDDAGSEFTNFLNISDNWNAVPYPSRLSIGHYFKNGLGLEAIASYNRFREGKTVDNTILTEDINYFAIDFRASYDLNKILGETGLFDPYVGLGIGYTDANNVSRGTFNGILGFRIWLSDSFGLDLNTTGKWVIGNTVATNHIQHAAGLVYRFGIEK